MQEYDELVEVVAKALGDVFPTHDFKDEAKTAIRAIQDWMPEMEYLAGYETDAPELYQNLKTLGRNDENN
jgi:hypothetical protein